MAKARNIYGVHDLSTLPRSRMGQNRLVALIQPVTGVPLDWSMQEMQMQAAAPAPIPVAPPQQRPMQTQMPPMPTPAAPGFAYVALLTASQFEDALGRATGPFGFAAYDNFGRLHSFVANSWPAREYGVIDATRLDTGENINVALAAETTSPAAPSTGCGCSGKTAPTTGAASDALLNALNPWLAEQRRLQLNAAIEAQRQRGKFGAAVRTAPLQILRVRPF